MLEIPKSKHHFQIKNGLEEANAIKLIKKTRLSSRAVQGNDRGLTSKEEDWASGFDLHFVPEVIPIHITLLKLNHILSKKELGNHKKNLLIF